MEKFMNALERYYQEYLFGYPQDTNWENYDIDMQLNKNRIECILASKYIKDEDVKFIKSLLPEIESEKIRNDLEEFIESIVI